MAQNFAGAVKTVDGDPAHGRAFWQGPLGPVEELLPDGVDPKRLRQMPASCARGYVRAVRGESGPRAAIKAFCLECVGWKRALVVTCPTRACPLWAMLPRRPDEYPPIRQLTELATAGKKRYRRSMTVDLADRLARVAGYSTLCLTHYGRRSGKPYEVTIWFMVEGETIYLVTANRERQWPRNVAVEPRVLLRIGDDVIRGQVEEITDRTAIEHVTDLMAAKYWYTWPYVWLLRLFSRRVPSAAFRVWLDEGATL